MEPAFPLYIVCPYLTHLMRFDIYSADDLPHAYRLHKLHQPRQSF